MLLHHRSAAALKAAATLACLLVLQPSVSGLKLRESSDDSGDSGSAWISDKQQQQQQQQQEQQLADGSSLSGNGSASKQQQRQQPATHLPPPSLPAASARLYRRHTTLTCTVALIPRSFWAGADPWLDDTRLVHIMIDAARSLGIRLIKHGGESMGPNPDFAFYSVFGAIKLVNNSGTPGVDRPFNVLYTAESLTIHKTHSPAKYDFAIGFVDDCPNCLRWPLLLDVPLGQMLLDDPKMWAKYGRVSPAVRREHDVCLVARSNLGERRTRMLATFDSLGVSVSCPSTLGHNMPSLGELGMGKGEFIRTCSFYLCPENSQTWGYVTEKFWDAIENGAVPIYWGNLDPSVPEFWMINPDRVIWIKGDSDDDFREAFSRVRDLLNDPAALARLMALPSLRPEAEQVIGNFRRNATSYFRHALTQWRRAAASKASTLPH